MKDRFGNDLSVGDFVVHLKGSDKGVYRIIADIKTDPNRDKALVICLYGANSTQECFDLVRGAFEIRGLKLGNVYCTDTLAKTFKPNWYPSEMKEQYLGWIDYLKETYKL